MLKDNQGLPKKSNENWQKGSSEDSVSGLIKGFASSTTAHGVGRIAESSDFRFRVTWFLVWLGVMISFTIMVVKLSLLYASKPVSTSISIVYEEVMKALFSIIRERQSIDTNTRKKRLIRLLHQQSQTNPLNQPNW